jgi:hypothetical protein
VSDPAWHPVQDQHSTCVICFQNGCVYHWGLPPHCARYEHQATVKVKTDHAAVQLQENPRSALMAHPPLPQACGQCVELQVCATDPARAGRQCVCNPLECVPEVSNATASHCHVCMDPGVLAGRQHSRCFVHVACSREPVVHIHAHPLAEAVGLGSHT